MIAQGNGIDFNAETHEYHVNGKKCLSVTEICWMAGLMGTVEDFRPQVIAAMVRGRNVHAACQYDDEGDLDDATITDEVRGYLDGWRKFRKDSGLVILHVEVPLADEALLVAGTPDRVGTLDGKKIIVDIKTGKPARWHSIQTFLYNHLAGRGHRRMGVYLTPTGTYSAVEHTNDRKDMAVAMAAITIAHFLGEK